MARKPRDYAGEYARRIEKNMAEGKSRTEARGHVSIRSLDYWIDKTAPKGMDPNEYHAAIDGAIQNIGTSEKDLRYMRDHLKKLSGVQAAYKDAKARGRTDKQASKESRGEDMWNDKEDWMPPEMFYYHDV
jgi:hypothetical protein